MRVVYKKQSGEYFFQCRKESWQYFLNMWKEGKSLLCPMPYGHAMFKKPESYGCVIVGNHIECDLI